MSGKKVFLLGNHALAKGAIAAGCNFVTGYPITPASEVLEQISLEFLNYPDRVYIQMEDEIASIAALIGASWAGAKTMTATSGPGFSLMQENLSYAYMTETPLVIAVLQRSGPSTGQATLPGQQEFYQARFGAHGDYEAIVFSPWSVQEMFDLAIKSFNTSEELRHPVILLADGEIGHMRENMVLPDPEEIKIVNRRRPKTVPYPPFQPDEDYIPPMPLFGEGHNLLITGSSHDSNGFRNADPELHRKNLERMKKKVQTRIDQLTDYHSELDPRGDAEIILISFGAAARPTYHAVRKLREEGIKTDFLRLRTLWPFNDKVIGSFLEGKTHAFVVEMNQGKLVREIERVGNKYGVKSVLVGKIGGVVHTSKEIIQKVHSELKKAD